jgi:hypothetical protein
MAGSEKLCRWLSWCSGSGALSATLYSHEPWNNALNGSQVARRHGPFFEKKKFKKIEKSLPFFEKFEIFRKIFASQMSVSNGVLILKKAV